MLRRRNCQLELFSLRLIMYQRSMVSIRNKCFHFLAGFKRPIITIFRRFKLSHAIRPEIVNHIAASDNQYAPAAKRWKALLHIILILGRAAVVQTHLDYRNIGSRVQMFNNAPAAVIESPFLIQSDICFLNIVFYFTCQLGTARCRILHIV